LHWLHGGRVEVASAGTGLRSEFTIALPPGTLLERAADPPAAAPESRRILVVDDNADAAMSLAVLLEMEGHQVITVRDAQSALRELDRFDAQLVLTDIGLPGMAATRSRI
jgi:PleD family two-component response regulator